MLFEKLKQVKGFVLDVDGVLTDGTVLVLENGEQLRSFHVRDGYALQLAIKKGYPIAAITGGNSTGVKLRLTSLGISDVFLNVKEKTAVLLTWSVKYRIDPEHILYMGDDIPDLKAMRSVGIKACPADAVEEIKQLADYISPLCGGKGAVRDVFEKVLKLQGNWENDLPLKSI